MVVLSIICLIALCLLVWFHTDAWLEYCRLLRLDFLAHYKDFDSKVHEDVTLDYNTYLRRHRDCFFTRLITCPICQGIWWGIVFGLLTCVWMAPIYIMGGLVLFYTMERLIG